MSLRNRARALQHKTGSTYQQALNRLKQLGARPAELAKETGWPLEVCDRFLVDGHAPIDVIEATAPADPIEVVCESLRVTANARAVLLVEESGRILCHVGPADVDRAVFLRTMSSQPPLPPELRERARRSLPDVWELDGGLVLAMSKVKPHAMLIVKFQQQESSLGIVRLRMKKAAEELERLLTDQSTPMAPPSGRGGPGGLPAQTRVAREEPEPRPKPKKPPLKKR